MKDSPSTWRQARGDSSGHCKVGGWQECVISRSRTALGGVWITLMGHHTLPTHAPGYPLELGPRCPVACPTPTKPRIPNPHPLTHHQLVLEAHVRAQLVLDGIGTAQRPAALQPVPEPGHREGRRQQVETAVLQYGEGQVYGNKSVTGMRFWIKMLLLCS